LLKLQFLGKLFYALNVLAALLLLISFVLPFLPPSKFPTLSILSLAVSPLILINLLFMVYWILRFKKRFWFSLVVVVIAYFHFHAFFEISSEGSIDQHAKNIKLLSYNVHLFNAYEKNPDETAVATAFSKLIELEKPDVICIQEFYAKNKADFSAYPYQFIHFKDSTHKLGHAIFSKYPILHKGSFDFEASYNNTLFADLLVNADTIRVYNLHLQSLGILPTVDFLQQRGTEQIKQRMSDTFVQQEAQVAKILRHKNECKYPVLFSGDFNNTSFSYIYRELKQGMQDAFQEKGNGLGQTYLFNYYPMRIDFILASEEFSIVNFDNIKKSFSDHYPIISTVGWD
jgi:endonuclease/exonuclease/phosphatase family metal-dependent hydrolase